MTLQIPRNSHKICYTDVVTIKSISNRFFSTQFSYLKGIVDHDCNIFIVDSEMTILLKYGFGA